MSTKVPSWVYMWLSLIICGFGRSRQDADIFVTLHGGLLPPGFSKSINDAKLMYEFLFSGLVIDTDNNVVLRDQELGSMRQGRAFVALFNDYVPKNLSTMEQFLATLQAQGKRLRPFHFEILVLGTIYSAYQVQRQKDEKEEQAWSRVLARLANATLRDLRLESP